jgi:hypothetical protein
MDLTRKRLERGKARVPQTHSLDDGEKFEVAGNADFAGGCYRLGQPFLLNGRAPLSLACLSVRYSPFFDLPYWRS